MVPEGRDGSLTVEAPASHGNEGRRPKMASRAIRAKDMTRHSRS